MKKLLYLIILFACLCMVACSEKCYEITIGEPIVIASTELGEHILVLRMYDGTYEFDYNAGLNQGSNWIGKYELVVMDTTNGKVVSTYNLQEWKESMRFSKPFSLNVVDYNEDGNFELLIGQRISANQSSYYMYYITSQLQMGCHADIGEIIISSVDFSPVLESSKDQLVYSTYDNSIGSWVQHTIDMEMLMIE